jgi:hypothetical protein
LSKDSDKKYISINIYKKLSSSVFWSLGNVSPTTSGLDLPIKYNAAPKTINIILMAQEIISPQLSTQVRSVS